MLKDSEQYQFCCWQFSKVVGLRNLQQRMWWRKSEDCYCAAGMSYVLADSR